MATVHPSRMGLVPQGNGDYSYRSHYRSRSQTPEPKRNRSRSKSPDRERERGRDYGSRRHSPEYDEYSKGTNSAPWHSQSNMYPERREGRGRRDNYHQTGSSDWFTHRQQIRDNKQVSIWPPSPKTPERSLSRSRSRSRSPHRKRHKKRSRRHDRSVTPSSLETDSSEEERRRKEKRAQRRREREEQRESKRRRHHERRERTRSKSVEEESRRRRRRSRTKTRSPSLEPDEGDEDEWVEKPAANAFTSHMVPSTIAQSSMKNATTAAVTQDDDSDTEFGPQPVFKASAKVDERSYGGSLLRGEGSAMAAFLAEDTNARIPRRGEIGLASDQIAAFEAAGYVMSGSRHRRMNAVRLRKENQVISAEEKRGILKLQKEERARREELLREEFKELMQDKLKVAGTKQPQPQ